MLVERAKKIINIAADLLSDAVTLLSTAAGSSNPHPIKKGVRQGDPISGFFFNIAIDPILRMLEKTALKVLAFADDILIIARNKTELQESLDVLHNSCLRLGLALNANKGFTMHITHPPLECADTTFLIGDEVIPLLKNIDEKKFLGKPIGFQLVTDPSDLHHFVETDTNSTIICSGSLAALQCDKILFLPLAGLRSEDCPIPERGMVST